jgi:hypothetical protein
VVKYCQEETNHIGIEESQFSQACTKVRCAKEFLTQRRKDREALPRFSRLFFAPLRLCVGIFFRLQFP